MVKDRHTNRKKNPAYKDLVGQVFGKLTVLEDSGERKNRRVLWDCKCECGNIVRINGKYLLSGDTKSCGCYSKGNAHNRKGYKDISGSYWGTLKSNAKKRGVPFEITPIEAWEVLQKQNGICALSGIELVLVNNYRDERPYHTASLDRIDSTKSYTKDNIQWVHKVINIMKNTLPQEEFIGWCIAVQDFANNNPHIMKQSAGNKIHVKNL